MNAASGRVAGRARSYLAPPPSRFWRFVWLSLALHLLFAGAAYWRTRQVEAPVSSLYQQAIMVQQVAWAPKERPKNYLPRLNAEPPAAKPEAIKLSKNPLAPALTPEEKDLEKGEDEKARARKKRMERALERMEKRADEIDGRPDGTPGALSSRAAEILGSVYAGQLRQVFQENWSVPGVIPKDELKRLACKIHLRIDRTGKVLSFELKSGSGNGLFDSSVQRALKLTPRVPLPDEMLRDLVLKEGILINFFLKE